MRRSICLLLLVCAVVLPGVLAGCGEKEASRPQRPKRFSKVVSLSPGTTEILMSHTDAYNLAGRTQADNWPTSVKEVPVVASVKPDYEKLAEIKPDLIAYDAALYSPQDLEKIKSTTNAEMFAMSANTLDAFIEQLYELGSLTASETRINSYVNKILMERQAAAAEEFNPRPKVAVLMPSASGSDYIVGTASFVADAVRAAGGDPVGPDAKIFVPINPETLLQLAPDVIVVPGTRSNTKGAELVMRNPKYQTLPAVKSGRIRLVDEDVLLRRGGRVDLLIRGLHKAFATGGAQ